MYYFETSAKQGINLQEAFKSLVKNILSSNINEKEIQYIDLHQQIDVNNQQENNQGNCCNN